MNVFALGQGHTFNKAKYSELVIVLMTSAWMSKTVTSLPRHAFTYGCPRNIPRNLVFAAYLKTPENVSLVPRGFCLFDTFVTPALILEKLKPLGTILMKIFLFSGKTFGQKCVHSLDLAKKQENQETQNKVKNILFYEKCSSSFFTISLCY